LKLQGKRAVITGASRGLGRAVARAFLREGASVLLCARNSVALDETRRELDETAAGRVFAVAADITNQTEVDALPADALLQLGGVDILVANAGLQGPKGPLEDNDWKKWVETVNVNLLGTVYCCRAFLPLLRSADRGKILILSGGGATKPMPFFSAYSASKAGVVRFGETLAEELKPEGIDVNMIAPGALNTGMLDEVLEAGAAKVGEATYRAALKQRDNGGASMDRAADLCVHLSSRDCDGITGRLISAPWDPWERLADYREELAGSDIYTLRRIVPEERGKQWNP
jgi:NAD(P)-dependent dehydrogenase (short-subunit alcohol dehydrogenase family)